MNFLWLLLPLPAAPALAAGNSGDGAVDLSSMGFEGFTPYVVERNHLWALLPAIALAAVVLHLKKNYKKPTIGRKME
jgi:hypothetical protein